MLVRLFFAVGLAIGLPALLQAQYNNRSQFQRQQPAGMAPVEFQGTIQGMAKGNLMVAANNQALRVALLPATKVKVTGATTANALRSGIIVEFVAKIDGRGAIQDKVDALTITSLTQEKQMGFSPSGDAKADDVPDGFDANARKDTDEAGGKHGKRPARIAGKTASRTQPAGSYRVIGRLIVGRGGTLSVQAGRGISPLVFDLADEAKIEVNTTDMSSFLTYVSRGNDVSIKGFVVPSKPPTIQAAEVQVKLPEPQASEKPEPVVRPEAKKSAKHSKKGNDEGEPAGDP